MAALLTPEILGALEARQVAFLEARLVSDEARRAWSANFAAARRELMAAKVGDLVDPAALASALDAALTGASVERVARPLAKKLLPVVLAELRAEPRALGDHVPTAARPKLEALVARKGALPERLLRELAEQEAIEEVMRDVLYDGFKEFSERVNPFTAEWGIPSLLKRMSLLGGAMTKGIEAVKAEFDRRLEPELRRYLAGFSRRGLERMVDVTIARADQPASVAVRRHLVAWVLEQQIATLAREADPEALALAQEIGLDIAAAELDRPEHRARRRTLIEAAVKSFADVPIEAALASLGVTLVFDDESAAAASWPLVKAALGTAAARAWIAELVREFYAAERAALVP
jgi:hypothetical protein